MTSLKDTAQIHVGYGSAARDAGSMVPGGQCQQALRAIAGTAIARMAIARAAIAIWAIAAAAIGKTGHRRHGALMSTSNVRHDPPSARPDDAFDPRTGDTRSESNGNGIGAGTAGKGQQSWLTVLLVLAGAKLILHLAINVWAGYGIFRDELYYLACADHLAWGYVDHPPLSIALLAAVRTLFGDSLFALRLVPAVAGSALVLVTGLLARELGGGRLAVTLAALGSMSAGFYLAVSSFWSMNCFDVLLTALACLVFARLLRRGRALDWPLLGLILGLALLNKVGALWIGLGVAVATLATGQRRWLRTPWPWMGGVLAALIFAPYLLWNAVHGWPHLEFIDSAVSGKYSGLDALSFLSGQILIMNPANLLLWLGGLLWLFFAPGRQGNREDYLAVTRPLGLIWLTACAVLLINGSSKASYLAPAYAPLLAAGGVAWEWWFRQRAVLRSLALVVVASGLLLMPLATPVLSVERYVRFASWLGMAPGTDEGHELAELPQFYADMFGWEGKARAVSEVYRALSPEDRARVVVYASNYGRAGAIQYYAKQYELPPVVSGHNNFWLWGPGRTDGSLLLTLGGSQQDLERRFKSVVQLGVATCDYCIPYERDLPIFLARDSYLPIEELWPLTRHYD